MKNIQTDFLFEIIFAFAAEIDRLTTENETICQEKADMESMMEMASLHADDIGADLLNKVDIVEHQFTEVLESIPVPAVIAKSDGEYLYANKNACFSFGFSEEDMLKQNARYLYKNPADREKFLHLLNQNGEVSNFEVEFIKSDGSSLPVSLFSRYIMFKNEKQILTILYDLTDRLKSEQEIRLLKEKLESEKEREEKYLMFLIASQEFGIVIRDVREIVRLVEIIPVPDVPDYIRGVANIRGRLIPVADMRLILGAGAGNHTEQACIIVVETENIEQKMIGILADSVTQILSIRGKDIEEASEIGFADHIEFISGIAKIGREVRILLNSNRLFKR